MLAKPNEIIIQVYSSGYIAIVLDRQKNRVIDYFFGSSKQSDLTLLKEKTLKYSTFDIQLIEQGPYTLVPQEYFLNSQKRKFIETINQDKFENIENLFVDNLGLHIIYSFPNHPILSNIPKHLTYNRSHRIARLLYFFSKKKMNDFFLLNLTRDYSIDCLIWRDKEFQFVNTNKVKSPEEILYHILFIYEQMQWNPEQMPIYLSGKINKKNSTYKLIYRYIRNIFFYSFTENISWNYKLKIPLAHEYIL